MRLPSNSPFKAALAAPSTSRILPVTLPITRRASTSPPPSSISPRLTTLPNKLRVVTEGAPTYVHSLGVFIDGGTRFESERTSGVTHLLDKMAFKSTARFTDAEMMTQIDQLGSHMFNASSRDFIQYQTTVFPQTLPLAVSLLSSTILDPLLLPHEVEEARSAAAYEIREAWAKAATIMQEVVHQTAYGGKTLGMPTICPENQLEVLGEREFRGYMRDWYRPERMVVAGFGIPHEELVELAEKHFGGMSASAMTTASNSTSHLFGGRGQRTGAKTFATVSSAPFDRELESDYSALTDAKAIYTGGETFIDKPDEEFVHLFIGFESLHATDPDVYTVAVMHSLLLGGSSFSQGGPGKGMFSRLHQNVLNRHHWVDLCQSLHQCYGDSGVFGIHAAVFPDYAPKIAEVVAGQLHALTGPMMGGVNDEQLRRAKNMLKSMMVMQTESRVVAVEDLGRQYMSQGYKESVQEMCTKIDAVTREDLWRVATRILRPSAKTKPLNHGLGSGTPTVVGIGRNLERLGDVKDVLRRWDLGKRA